MRFCDRVDAVSLTGSDLPADLLSELGSLTNLERLSLSRAHLSDGAFQNLKVLTNLETLELSQTDVTDAAPGASPGADVPQTAHARPYGRHRCGT